MPKARNRFERSRQLLRWMQHEWPTGRPVKLRWARRIIAYDEDGKPEFPHGVTERKGRNIVITLSESKCRTWETMTEILIHEYTHAAQWGMARNEHRTPHHPPWFYVLEGEIKDRFHHDCGWEHANEFPTD